MKIEEKEAVSIVLDCPLRPGGCPGMIYNEILMYLNEDHELVVFGKCDTCEAHGYLTVSLMDVLSRAPVKVVM